MVDQTIYPNIHDYLNGKIKNYSIAQKMRVVNSSYEIALEDEEEDDDNTTQNQTEQTEQKVAILNINGMIQRNNVLTESGEEISTYGTDYITSCIQSCTKDESIKAIILDVNSGGGYSNAVANMIDAIQQFKKTGRKVYASVDIAASAGYHIVSFCDYVVGNSKSSIFGCIGTMWSAQNVAKMYQKAGIEDITVISDQTPDKGAEYIQALNGDSKLLKENIINPTAQAFIDDVLMNRKIKNQMVLKGSAMTSIKAIETGLCDAIMPMSELIKVAMGDEKITYTIPKKITQKIKSSININEKNIMSFNIFGAFSKAKAGESTPEEDGQVMAELARYQALESNLTATISSQNLQIGSLQNQLTDVTNAKEEALLQVTALTEQVADLTQKLQNTAGAPAQTAILNGSELTPVTQHEKVPGLKAAMDDFKRRLAERYNGLS